MSKVYGCVLEVGFVQVVASNTGSGILRTCKTVCDSNCIHEGAAT